MSFAIAGPRLGVVRLKPVAKQVPKVQEGWLQAGNRQSPKQNGFEALSVLNAGLESGLSGLDDPGEVGQDAGIAAAGGGAEFGAFLMGKAARLAWDKAMEKISENDLEATNAAGSADADPESRVDVEINTQALDAAIQSEVESEMQGLTAEIDQDLMTENLDAEIASEVADG